MSRINVENIRHPDAASDSLQLSDTGNITAPGNLSVTGTSTLTGNTVVTGSLTANGLAYPSAGPLSNRNLLYNPEMKVAQRGTTITNVGIDTFMLDRWKQFASVGTTTGRSTATQETITDLEGFRTALKLQVTTADTDVAATDLFAINQRLEAQDILWLDIGGTNSRSLTLSFWAKAPTGNGVFCAGLVMPGGGHYVEEVTIGTSWARHVINIPATTTSSHATTQTGTANGMEVVITLMAGSSRNGSTNGAWGSGTNNRATSNQSNFYSSTSNNLWVTGVQLEVGDVATPFEHRSFGDELARCQRYYYKAQTTGSNSSGFFGTSYNRSTTSALGVTFFPVELRVAPTALEQSGTASDYQVAHGTGGTTCTSVPAWFEADTFSARTSFTTGTSLTVGQGSTLRSASTDAFLAWSAEL